MKEKVIIILLIVILLIALILFLLSRKKIEITNIKSLHFSYSVSNAMYGNVSYDLKYNNSVFIAVIKPNGVSEEEAKEVDVNNEFVNSIEELLKKFEVGKWDGFNKSDKNVLDGNSFSFNIKMDNNTSIYASGYMKYPKNYSEVKKELDRMFNNLLKEEK